MIRSAVFFLILCLSMSWSSGTALADAKSMATEQLRAAVDEVIATLKDERLAQPGMAGERRKRITEIVSSRFDFEEMAKRSLGMYWKDRTPEERESFVKLFKELLSASYMGNIETYTDEKVVYLDAVEKGPYIWVDTAIETKQKNIPIVYRMIEKDGSWWVYDVVIEEVSLVSTYRSQFNKTITQDSYEGLVRKLEDKLDEIRALDKANGAQGSDLEHRQPRRVHRPALGGAGTVSLEPAKLPPWAAPLESK